MAFKYFTQRLLGAFELSILMKQGLSRFDGTKREALLSFLVVFITLPISFAGTMIYPPLGTEGISTPYVFFVHFCSDLATFFVGVLLLYGFAKYVTKNTEKIWLFYGTSNWIAWIFIPFGIGLSLLKYGQVIEDKTMEDLLLVFALYGYYLGGFILFHIFRPPWELAAAFVCGMLVLGQTILDLSYRIAGFPLVDYMDVFG